MKLEDGVKARAEERTIRRCKNLFDSLCSLENLEEAAQKARLGKRYTKAAMQFHNNIEVELPRLQQELEEGTYLPGPYHTFRIYDDKPRLISAAPYRDRVAHHALCNIIEPIFERTFIHDSYACRKEKGTHAAANRLTFFMQNYDYALQCDIRRFFPSVDHAILKSLLRLKIGCERTLDLCDIIIDSSDSHLAEDDWFPGDNLFTPSQRRRGLPIGNQTSQFFSNVYLDRMDHFIRERLGFHGYLRYADDFILLSDSKEILNEARTQISRFLSEKLRIRLHFVKQKVSPATLGLDFVGYVIFPEHRRLRRNSGYRFARRLRKMQRLFCEGRLTLNRIGPRIAAWQGHARHADTHGLRAALLGNAVFSRAKAQASRPPWRFLEQQQSRQLPRVEPEQQQPVEPQQQ